MIKFGGTHLGKKLIGIGLSEGNLQRLKEGMPILVNSEDFEKLSGVEAYLLILYGKTEEEMVKEMYEAGIKMPGGLHGE